MTGPPFAEGQGQGPPSLTPPGRPAEPSAGPQSQAYPAYPGVPAYAAQGAGVPGYPPGWAWAWNGYQWVPDFAGSWGPPGGPYERMRGKAMVATVLYVIAVGAAIFGIVALAHRYSLVSSVADAVRTRNPGGVDPTAADTADNLVVAAWTTYLVAVLLAAIALLVFLHGVQRNNRVLGAYELRFSPGWVVGWSLIPIANIVMHWIVLSDVEKTARDPRGRPTRMARQGLRIHPAVVALPVLWVCAFILNIVGSSYSNSSLDAATSFNNLIDRAHVHDGVYIGLFALVIATIGLYVTVIRRILRSQELAAGQAGVAA